MVVQHIAGKSKGKGQDPAGPRRAARLGISAPSDISRATGIIGGIRTGREDAEESIQRTAQGDRAAFRALYGCSSAKLFAIAPRLLNDRAGAEEEALQDVHIKLWHKAARYTANGLGPMTWLITIARNAAIDRRRSSGRRESAAPREERIADRGAGPEGAAYAPRAESFAFMATTALAGMDTPMVGGAPMFADRTIVENAVNSADHETLVAAVKAAGLVETLQGEGPFTVSAPTDAAFGKLREGAVEALPEPEAGRQLMQGLT